MKNLLLAAALGSNTYLFAEQNAITQISSEIEQYLKDFHAGRLQPNHRIEVSVGYIDPRLNLPKCSGGLQLALTGNQQGIGGFKLK